MFKTIQICLNIQYFKSKTGSGGLRTRYVKVIYSNMLQNIFLYDKYKIFES